MTRLFVLASAVLLSIGLAGTFTEASARVASLVVDAGTGRTLQSTNADAPHSPASLTKMMTLYLLFDELAQRKMTLSTKMRVSRRAASMPPTKLGLAPGSQISVRDAILALVTESANDVAVVIAEALAGSEAAFAQTMTKKARTLGMRRTTFRTASGLPHAKQKTTARDMAKLARALLRDHPRFYPMFATRVFVHRSGRHRNHNGLLFTYRGADGVKTGFTRAAGYNLVASAKRGKVRLIGVVLGASSSAERARTMTKLLDKGFRRAPADRAVAAKSSVKKSSARPKSSVRRTKGRTVKVDVATSRRPRKPAAAPSLRPKVFAQNPPREEMVPGQPRARPTLGRGAPSG